MLCTDSSPSEGRRVPLRECSHGSDHLCEDGRHGCQLSKLGRHTLEQMDQRCARQGFYDSSGSRRSDNATLYAACSGLPDPTRSGQRHTGLPGPGRTGQCHGETHSQASAGTAFPAQGPSSPDMSVLGSGPPQLEDGPAVQGTLQVQQLVSTSLTVAGTSKRRRLSRSRPLCFRKRLGMSCIFRLLRHECTRSK